MKHCNFILSYCLEHKILNPILIFVNYSQNQSTLSLYRVRDRIEVQLKETSRRHHPLIPVISVQSSNYFAQSAMWRSLHSLQISPSRYPCSRCSTTATIISGGTTRRGNSNYTLTVWKRWLKQTEGRPLYYLTLHLFSSPISSNNLPQFLSPAQSLLKILSLFSSVSNYLHLLSGHLRIKTWWDHSQGATPDLTISFTLFCCCLHPVNYTKCLSSESHGRLHRYLFHFDFHEARQLPLPRLISSVLSVLTI